jgi:hypothetical protein
MEACTGISVDQAICIHVLRSMRVEVPKNSTLIRWGPVCGAGIAFQPEYHSDTACTSLHVSVHVQGDVTWCTYTNSLPCGTQGAGNGGAMIRLDC